MRSKRAANSSSSRTIFSLLSLVLFLLLLGGGGGIVVVSVSSSFRTEDICGVCARERACLCRACSALCLSLLCYLLFLSRLGNRQKTRDENANVKRERERERDRERTQSEIDYYCSRGLSASLEENFFFFFNSQSHWKRRSFFCHAATLRSLSWKTFLTLSSGLKFVVLLSFSRTREFPRPFHLEQLLSALLSAREI